MKFIVDGKQQVGTVLRVYGGPHDMYDVKVGASTLTLADTPMTAANATGDKREYYVVDAWGNKADGSITPLPFDRASALFLKLTGSKNGNGKWGIVHKDEPNSKARDWYGNIVEWSVSNNSCAANGCARNAAGNKVRVKLETITFSQGLKPEVRVMGMKDFETLLKMLGLNSEIQEILRRLAAQGSTDIAVGEPNLEVEVV